MPRIIIIPLNNAFNNFNYFQQHKKINNDTLSCSIKTWTTISRAMFYTTWSYKQIWGHVLGVRARETGPTQEPYENTPLVYYVIKAWIVCKRSCSCSCTCTLDCLPMFRILNSPKWRDGNAVKIIGVSMVSLTFNLAIVSKCSWNDKHVLLGFTIIYLPKTKRRTYHNVL